MPQYIGWFDIPVKNISLAQLLKPIEYIANDLKSLGFLEPAFLFEDSG